MKTESNKTLSGSQAVALFVSLAYVLGCFLFPEAFGLVRLKAFFIIAVFGCMFVEFLKK